MYNTIRKLEAAGHVDIAWTWATNSRETIQGKDTFKLQLTEQWVFRVNAEHTNLRSTNIWGVALKRDAYPSISTVAAFRFRCIKIAMPKAMKLAKPYDVTTKNMA